MGLNQLHLKQVSSLQQYAYTLALAVVVLAVSAMSLPALAGEKIRTVDGYAVEGHDPVAYFTDSKPTVGKDEFTAEHEGAKYRFASAANRDKFVADPAKFAPQYGGYCAFGAAMARKFPGDPNAWHIADNKLYLNLNKDVQSSWLKDTDGFIRGADNNWPLIAEVADSELEKNQPAGTTTGAQ